MHQRIRGGLTQTQGLWLGIAFSLAFTVVIWLADSRLGGVSLRPDRQVAYWYPWVTAAPTIWTRISVWGLYLAHQLTIWGLIWYAQSRRTRYSDTLHPVNLWALAANAGFIVLHFAQTHLFYDGLGLDVSEQSSQWSVILLLVIVLLMENQRRGLFFGWKVPGTLMREAGRGVRKYHGYYFAWATIYTFWYHPMVGTPGHLLGFLYIFLLLLQGSLFFTRIHTNRWWTITQEVLVLLHGTLVALSNAPRLWQMFCFGFAGLFIVTQMHGLGLSRAARWAFLALYVGGALAVYSRIGFDRIHQVAWIPFTEYAVTFLVAALVWIGMRAAALRQRRGAGE
ncbi:hypothetical protein Pan44_46270 [Caulifigura coniformis]|uniref:Serine active site containing 1-like protein n=1 Tax=Caulifigura coniformis TaxID=2527983 RepID=A0A517SKC6_9PLAN|nr:hypothetical protein [Caulifigura coniformis]QDT56571.1 hypothetical protein Pan44_46270 [Caulifigura coniformis]